MRKHLLNIVCYRTQFKDNGYITSVLFLELVNKQEITSAVAPWFGCLFSLFQLTIFPLWTVKLVTFGITGISSLILLVTTIDLVSKKLVNSIRKILYIKRSHDHHQFMQDDEVLEQELYSDILTRGEGGCIVKLFKKWVLQRLFPSLFKRCFFFYKSTCASILVLFRFFFTYSAVEFLHTCNTQRKIPHLILIF